MTTPIVTPHPEGKRPRLTDALAKPPEGLPFPAALRGADAAPAEAAEAPADSPEESAP